MTHNLDEPPLYCPQAGPGGQVDRLMRDLAETREALHQAHADRDAAQREALQWKQRATHYRHWFERAVGRRVVGLCEEAAPALFAGLQEHLDRSA
jgi:hypothetical protein